MRRARNWCIIALMAAVSPAFGQTTQSVAPQIAKVKAIGKEGQGHLEAMAALKALVAAGQPALPQILAGLDDASPLASNWLRAAFETVVQNQLAAGQKIDPKPLVEFLQDTKHAGISRRLAYETLVKLDPATKDRMAGSFLDDPGRELRRDAVELVLKDGQKALDANDASAKPLFQKAFTHARDLDQVQLAATRLKKLGVETDLTAHFGFIMRWSIVGPFDNSKGVGFNAQYPPDKGVDLAAEIVGKGDSKVAWKEAVADRALGAVDLTKLGVVDLAKIVGPLKGAVAYGYAIVESPSERPIEVRCGSNNAVRMSLNGKEIYFREEYHHGMTTDQHTGKGLLKTGKNEILIKVCQNEQTEPWAQLWSFQVRLTDHLGGAVPFKN